jgi:AraC-like DNA-binding protein
MNSIFTLRDFLRVPCRQEVPHPERQGPTLPAMVTAVGHERVTAAPYEWDGLRRGRSEFAILQYTLEGAGALRRGDRAYVLKPGDAMLLTVPDAHRYWLPAGGSWRFFHVTLHGHEVVRLWRHALLRLGPVVRIPFDAPILQEAAALCAGLISGQRYEATELSGSAYGITLRLLELARRQAMPATSPGPQAESLERCITYCREHLATPLDVEAMARKAGYSRHHFTRLFTAHTGVSPGAFLIRERLRVAVRLLQTSTLPVKGIAPACGYGDVNYFCRVFRAVMGMSPGDFRRHAPRTRTVKQDLETGQPGA